MPIVSYKPYKATWCDKSRDAESNTSRVHRLFGISIGFEPIGYYDLWLLSRRTLAISNNFVTIVRATRRALAFSFQ